MLAQLRHPAAAPHRCLCDSNELVPSADPTGTGKIRRRYRGEVNARWQKLIALTKNVVVEQDLFGLASAKLKGAALTFHIAVPENERVAAFTTWLRTTIDRVVLEGDALYLQPMISASYTQAVKRAKRMTQSQTVPYGFLHTSKSILDLALSEMRGIAEVVTQVMTRRVAEALLVGLDPLTLNEQLAHAVQTIGINRTNTMINTLVVKAHSMGTLDQFQSDGVTHVGIIPETLTPFTDALLVSDAKRKGKANKGGPGSRLKGRQPSKSTINRIRKVQKKIKRLKNVEVITAGDDDVCEECEGIAESSPYPIDEARSLIPAHPNCRCAFAPVSG